MTDWRWNETAFKSLKRHKALGLENVHLFIVKPLFDEIREPLRHILKSPLKKVVSPGNVKVAEFAPIFKTGKGSCIFDVPPK